MASNTVTSSNFNAQKISFSQMKSLDSGGKQAFVNYDGSMFVMQTPNCSLPFGMSAFDKAGPVKYSVELSLRGHDEVGSKVQQWFQTLNGLDEHMIDQGVKNSKQWFKADLSRDVIKAFYTPMVRYSKDKDGNVKPYPPNVKLSLRKKRDSSDFDVQCYDDQRELYRGIPLEELLVRGAQMTSLIQCTGVWVAGSKYGLSWKLVQSVISSLPQNSRRFAFVDDGELEAPKARSGGGGGGGLVRAPTATATDAISEDGEEEEEEEEEEAETFAPPPPSTTAAAAAAKKPSVLAALMPKAPVAQTLDDAADDAEPIPVPKKMRTTTVMKKKVVAAK